MVGWSRQKVRRGESTNLMSFSKAILQFPFQHDASNPPAAMRLATFE